MSRTSARLLRTVPPTGHLWVECHCQRGVAAVPVELIGRETGPCERCRIEEPAA